MMKEIKALAKKTYTIDLSKYRGHMTVTNDGRAIVVYASFNGHVLTKLFTDESKTREWCNKELATKFRKDPFHDLLNSLLELERQPLEDREHE